MSSPPQKKVMFFPTPLKGHLTHTARMAEWFLEFPEYEVHVCASADSEAYLPGGITFHANPHSAPCSSLEKAFSKVSEGRTPLEATAIMLREFDIPGFISEMKFAIGKLIEVMPHVAIYEHGFNLKNTMHTACTHLKIPSVMLVAMARPETAVTPLKTMRRLTGHPRLMMRVVKAVGNIAHEVEPVIGRKLIPDRERPVTLYPGALILCEVPPKPNEIYTGPFCPLPLEIESSSPSASGGNLVERQSPELAAWVESKRGASTPLIYIALGTLATPSKELLARIVDALDEGPWGVIWGLPEAQQALLPRQLSSQWYVDKFLPQAEIFQAKLVKCFVSHCGLSSTTEAISNGIPMVCLPFFGDQFEWANSICSHVGAGIKIDKFKSTSSEIREAVRSVLEDDRYCRSAKAAAEEMTQNAKMRLEFLGDKLEGPVQRAGVPVAAAVMEKCMAGEDPLDALPPTLRPKSGKAGKCICWPRT